jgi:hypothetical protein
MQTGSTNNHISQIFFVLAAPTLMVRYTEFIQDGGMIKRQKEIFHKHHGPQTYTFHLPPSQPPLFLTVRYL